MLGRLFYSLSGLYQVGAIKRPASTVIVGFRDGFLKISRGKNMDSGSRSAFTSDMSKDLLFTANVESIAKLDTATL